MKNKESKPKKLKVKNKTGKWVFKIKVIHTAVFAGLSVLLLVGFSIYQGFSPSELLTFSFYESLANPSVRVVHIREGLRKEEVAMVLEDKLNWTGKETEEFLNAHEVLGRSSLEGYFFPKSYFLHKDTEPVKVAEVMVSTLENKMRSIKKPKNKGIVNEDTVLKIASLIQRESGGKQDMNLISGIIWNRIFSGMKLQVDATLQYAKGNENGWWPSVKPEDKYIESPYNTYLYKDLPPTPISSPGLSAIEAAYNPVKTSCIFYMHDKKGKIHCSKTYEEHKRNIDRYY
jgi:UPF0755 protein